MPPTCRDRDSVWNRTADHDLVNPARFDRHFRRHVDPHRHAGFEKNPAAEVEITSLGADLPCRSVVNDYSEFRSHVYPPSPEFPAQSCAKKARVAVTVERGDDVGRGLADEVQPFSGTKPVAELKTAPLSPTSIEKGVFTPCA